VDLARGELWKDAQETIQKAAQLSPEDETVAWNSALIGLIAARRAEAAQEPDSPYPLLQNIFWRLRRRAELAVPMPERLFNPAPLVAGQSLRLETNVKDYVRGSPKKLSGQP
jgi:hypothetical protein